MRDSKWRFVKGYDADRHVFTKAKCIAGYDALVIKVGGSCGISEAKRRAYYVICCKDAVRYNNPALIPVKPVQFKTPKDHKEEYRKKHEQDR